MMMSLCMCAWCMYEQSMYTPMPECMCGGQRGSQFPLSILGCENKGCAARAEQVLSAEPSHRPCF